MTFQSTNDKIDEASLDAGNDGYHIGTVIFNDDPDGINRIKVSIPNLFDDTDENLPWVAPSPYSPFGIGSGFGSYGSPAIGSEVKVYFQDGDVNYGFYESSLLSKKNANPKFKNPNTWGFKDPDGNELYVNMETHVWEFTTHAGTTLKHTADGDFNLNIVRDTTEHVGRDSNTTIEGKLNITVNGGDAVITVTNGNLVADVTGNATINTTGNASIEADGSASVTALGAATLHGSSVTVSADSTVTISGTNVNIN